MEFEKYPFEKLRALFAPLSPAPLSPIALTIGEPQFSTPKAICDALVANVAKLNKYPNSSGEATLKDAVCSYVSRRYQVALTSSEVVLTFGTREALFNLPQFLLFDKPNPTIAYPNPFYQIYEGAAKMARARVLYMPLVAENGFSPSLSPASLESVDVVILNSPNNPTGAALSFDSLCEWVRLALAYDFVIISDECYGDIYENEPPASILQACIAVGNTSFKNILALNSASKRSSAPGLRSGYVAGDSEILQHYMRYRTYVGCAVPLPLQDAAIVAWNDDVAAKEARAIYRANFALAREILGATIAPYTFYVWLFVGDDIAFARELYQTQNVSVLPGRFLGREGSGAGFVRIALVYDTPTCKEALVRIAKVYEKMSKK
ncbi:MAG: succinyldiaminopimelate transaminase [Helicobacter sp.]|nr:succinyldiaminopimelate transaminase [Helicobacter sp.]